MLCTTAIKTDPDWNSELGKLFMSKPNCRDAVEVTRGRTDNYFSSVFLLRN